jgi:hypothetical protein
MLVHGYFAFKCFNVEMDELGVAFALVRAKALILLDGFQLPHRPVIQVRA